MIYQKTKNMRAIQLLLGHSNLNSTVRYLGIELDGALDVAKNTVVDLYNQVPIFIIGAFNFLYD